LCLFSPTSTYRKEAELILLDARQAPFQILFVCGGACLGLLAASWAKSLGRMLARRMLRAACRDSVAIGRRDLGGGCEWQAPWANPADDPGSGAPSVMPLKTRVESRGGKAF
jgi:hypothetical protein